MAKQDKGMELLEADVPSRMPVITLKSTVAFPLSISNVRLAVPRNLAVLKHFPSNNTLIAVGILINPEGPMEPENVGPIAMACRIISRLNMGDKTAQVVLQGLKRVRLGTFTNLTPYLEADAVEVKDTGGDAPRLPQMIERTVELFEKLVKVDPRFPEELLKVLRLNLGDPARFADLIPTLVNFPYTDKCRLLEATDVPQRMQLILNLLQKEISRGLVARDVEKKTEFTIQKAEREAFLREQLAVIHEELGESDPMEAEVQGLVKRVSEAKLPKEAEDECFRELQRLRMVGPRSAETSVIRTYLDWMLSLPWHATTQDHIDLRKVRKELDENHYGLDDVKDRIIEFLAVRKLGGGAKSSVLCIVGPPGTGKTSLGLSIAEAIGRKFVRFSVGGVHDESEIRGHRRTYVGALPGRIIQGLRRAGTKNPVMIVDEIDKMDRGPQGDPAAAMLEVLDPEQNSTFVDHFLAVPFDLSKVLFVCTANLDDYIPEPLLDRMEVIYLSGYTELEKFWIAKKHIWPKVIADHGLKNRKVRISDNALRTIIRLYTQEAGVRDLTRTLEQICRRIAARVASNKTVDVSIGEKDLEEPLGPAPYTDSETEKRPEVGVATGLAWTAAGGDLLLIEALKMPGDGKITVTGYLGEVMRESVSAALSYVRYRSNALGIDPESFQKLDVHIHFPEGAIPKDGPSAGITIATAIASLLSGRPILHTVAMTGEISLRGKVLPVGGIREKMLAAYRAGIQRVILPKANAKDIEDLPKEVKQKLKFTLVETVDQVFAIALAKYRVEPRMASRRSTKTANRKRVAKRGRR